MSPCARYALMLGARPGELTADESAGYEQHLASCAACQARLADLVAVDGLLAEALTDEANRRDFATFSDEVLARVAPRAPTPWGWARRRWRLVAAGLIPALAAIAAVVYLGRAAQEGPPALVEVSSQLGSPTVIETSEGPIVLLGEDEPVGS